MHTPNPVYSHNPHDQNGFPLLVLQIENQNCTPFNEGFGTLHWHNEIQFVYLLKGTIQAQVHQSQLLLHAGEALFINRNAIHFINGSESCSYHSYLIPEKMLCFFQSSTMETNHVHPITHNACFTHSILTPSNKNHFPVLHTLKTLDELYMNQSSLLYPEYQLSVRLVQLWQNFILTLPPLPPMSEFFKRDLDRIQTLLTYIHENYHEDLSLSSIASAAHISKSECQRTFLKFTHISPYQYLIRYRLQTAAALLKTTEKNISSIASCIGFSSVSSFTHYFKKQYGVTPSKYRHPDLSSQT